MYSKVIAEENQLGSQLAKPGTRTFLCIMRVQAAGLGAFKESIKQVDFFEAWKIIAGCRTPGGGKMLWPWYLSLMPRLQHSGACPGALHSAL